MKLSAEQVRGITELREKLQEKLEQLQQEVDMTTLNIDALDAALSQSSFTRASQYTSPDTSPSADVEPQARPAPHRPQEGEQRLAKPNDAELQSADAEPQARPAPPSEDNASPIMVNDSSIGGISRFDDKISIKLYIPISTETPPFRSFFISRIIGGMIDKDTIEVESGRLSKDLVMRYELKTQGDMLDQIIVYNYRLEERAREIASTIRWALSRMLEHAR